MVDQPELFDPRPGDVPGLVSVHLSRADKHRKAAARFEAHCMPACMRAELHAADAHERCAVELGMLAEFYELGGVR